MRFRPCIDLKDGRVVQIVGGSLSDTVTGGTEINFTSTLSAADYASRYRNDALAGGHVIALGKGNEKAALSALGTWPGGMQYGGGVTLENAKDWLEAGASHVIVTSWIFNQGHLDRDRLQALAALVGRDRLVLDLSCRRREGAYCIVVDRWQTFTDETITQQLLVELSDYCAEFLVHGVDVEGRMQGIEAPLISLLAEHSPLPVTYAGGIRSLEDMQLVRELGLNRVDATIGSALDIFGGPVSYDDVVAWCRSTAQA